MSLTEIFTDSLKYPFSDMIKFCILGVIMTISSLGSLDLGNETLTLILGIIGFIASIIAGGYGVSIVKNAIIRSDEIPDFDLQTNLIDGIKMIILAIVYYIIPFIITVIIAFASGFFNQIMEVMAYASQYGPDFVNMVPEDVAMSLVSSAAITVIIGIVLFVIFTLLLYMGVCRLAKYNSLSEGVDIPEAARDLKRIGIGKIIGWMVLLIVIISIITFISMILTSIPYIGVLISAFLVSTYNLFIAYRSVGLLYSYIE